MHRPKGARNERDDFGQQEAIEKAWKVLNLQADTILKLAQARIEVWKVAVAAMAAGGALVAGTAALAKIFQF